MRARTTARTTASKTANASEDLRGGALRAACGVQRSRGSRGRARGTGEQEFVRSSSCGGVISVRTSEPRSTCMLGNSLRLYKAALNSKHPLVQPPRSSFLGPRTRARRTSFGTSKLNSEFRFLSPQTSRTCTQHLSFRVFSHWHWALGRAHCPLSGAPLRALAAARRAPLARLIMCAPSRGLRLGLRSHTRFDVAPAAHMQHSYSPISSISQGGLRFMQPGHTP